MKKKILMIATGGTIASKQTKQGLAPGLSANEILSYIPDVMNMCDVDTIQIYNIDSTNIMPSHWEKLVETIEQYYHAYDGFVVCHGTDTLAYTAAALSYMIQNSLKPIVITGAQKPVDQDISDAKRNLIDSFVYVCDDQSQGVQIVFNGKVIIGTRGRKQHAKSYYAFTSLNFPYKAIIQDQKIFRYLPEEVYQENVSFFHQMSNSIYVLKLIPCLKKDILTYLFHNYDCIIIESYGVGGIPDYLLDEFYKEMSYWQNKGKFVVITTQVANEGSDMSVYEVGKKVKNDFGLIEAYDMTLESVLTKMMWLMANYPHESDLIKKYFYQKINHDILFANL